MEIKPQAKEKHNLFMVEENKGVKYKEGEVKVSGIQSLGRYCHRPL